MNTTSLRYDADDPQIAAPPNSGAALRQALLLAGLFALLKFILHFGVNLWESHIGWGYFRDEMYYILCGRHMARGYVDHGPIVALQARLGQMLFGSSVFAIRILSALAGAISTICAQRAPQVSVTALQDAGVEFISENGGGAGVRLTKRQRQRR